MSMPVSDTPSLGIDVPEAAGHDDPPPELPPARPHLGDRIFAGVVRGFGITVLATPALMFLSLLVA
jgi:hypothetical protein